MTEDIQTKIETFFAQYSARKYAKGQVLLLAGDKVPNVFHLTNGKVKVYDVNYRGDEIILNVFKPPAFFPMAQAINNQPNMYIYEAETDIELRQAPSKEAVEFIKANPDVMYDLLSRLYIGVDGLLGRIASLMSATAQGRLIYEILIESRRFGKETEDDTYSLNISEKDLGARAGLSRETVSRELKKLKAEGLITVGHKELRVSSIERLQEKLARAL